MSQRISKSTIDFCKLKNAIGKLQLVNFLKFKARHDSYLTRINQLPEDFPKIDFNEYKNKLTNKSIVEQLEKAYTNFSIPYPEDSLLSQIEQQEKDSIKETEEFKKFFDKKISEAEEMLYKFNIMIPYEKMTNEDFVLTFPDWGDQTLHKSLPPHYERTIGFSKKEQMEALNENKDENKHFSHDH